MTVLDVAALCVLAIFPTFPLNWLAVHGLRRLWKRLGGQAIILVWGLMALLLTASFWFVFAHRGEVLGLRASTGVAALGGWSLLAAWLFSEYWIARELGVVRLVGLSELLSPGGGAGPITGGPYSLLRHPRYASDWLLFLGLFLSTGLWAMVGLCLYWAAGLALVIPLEERELVERFGEAYLCYRRRVPALFPRLRRSR